MTGLYRLHDGRTSGPMPDARPLRRHTWCVMLAVIMLAAVCRPSVGQTPVQTAAPDGLQTRTERGPVVVDVRLVPDKPRLSDEPVLTLTVTAQDGVRVELPPFGESLGGFLIRDFHEPLARTADGKQILQQIYTLEPASAGSVSIDPITIRFVDERPDGDGKQHEVQTEALLVDVQTMIASEAPSLNDLRPVTDPVELPATLAASDIALYAAGAVGCVVVLFLLWRMLRPQKKAEPDLTPQQMAWRELNDLLGSKLSEHDVKEFFVQLTAVVRRYIERTTGIKPPEQTTEEFLREINQQQRFSTAENTRLEAFLESADLVKFAGYQPDAESIKESTHRARQFIELKAGSDPDTPAPSIAEATS